MWIPVEGYSMGAKQLLASGNFVSGYTTADMTLHW